MAAVGITTSDAVAAGIAVRTVDYKIGHLAGSAALDRCIRSTYRVVVDEQRRVIVGTAFPTQSEI